MDYQRRLLNFQLNGLGYRFKNLDLLQEALTHSLDPQDHCPEFPEQNRNFTRLQSLGNAVLKFTVSQFVVQCLPVTASEGDLTCQKDRLIGGDVQKEIGKKLILEVVLGGKSDELWKLLRFCRAFKVLRNAEGQIPWEKVVRGLMGAVYLDSGGISGEGLAQAGKLFWRLWGEIGGKIKGGGGSLQGIQAKFPNPGKNTRDFWRRKGINEDFVEEMETAFGVELDKAHLLVEAVIQKTFYDGGIGLEGNPDYQRLEFLGDSVLGLVVTEVLWRGHYLNGGDEGEETPLDHKITGKISKQAQLVLARKLGLRKFVRMKPGGIPGWSMHDDLVESLVGAVFVDGGGSKVKKFVKRVWSLEETKVEPTLDNLQTKLGYKFRNPNLLSRALTLNTSSERDRKFLKILSYFGKSWIEFQATDYTLRTCEAEDSLPILVHRRNALCGEKILLRIGSYLNLWTYLDLSRDQKLRGLEPYMFYEEVMYALVGAIFKDMQEAKIKMAFGKVFYRLWSPFLGKCPRNTLIPQKFRLNGTLGYSEITEVETLVCHGFKNRRVLEEIFSTKSLNCYPGRWSWVGEVVAELAVKVYIAILSWMHLQNEGVSVEVVDVDLLHGKQLNRCVELAKEMYQPDGILRQFLEGTDLESSRISDNELVKRIWGAVYVDMASEDRSADVVFSKWKDYFITECAFISDNSNGLE